MAGVEAVRPWGRGRSLVECISIVFFRVRLFFEIGFVFEQ